MTEVEIAWLAGIIEGEGCFTQMDASGRPSFKIKMTDLDVMEKVGALLELDVKPVKMYEYHHTQAYEAKTTAMDKVATIILLIIPYMGKRRTEKMRERLTWIIKAKLKKAIGSSRTNPAQSAVRQTRLR